MGERINVRKRRKKVFLRESDTHRAHESGSESSNLDENRSAQVEESIGACAICDSCPGDHPVDYIDGLQAPPAVKCSLAGGWVEAQVDLSEPYQCFRKQAQTA